jgi:hypothetical protein
MTHAMRLLGLWLIMALFSIIALQPTPALAAPKYRYKQVVVVKKEAVVQESDR